MAHITSYIIKLNYDAYHAEKSTQGATHASTQPRTNNPCRASATIHTCAGRYTLYLQIISLELLSSIDVGFVIYLLNSQ